MAYEIRLVLQGIYERKDGDPMAPSARMVEGQLEGILGYWTRGLTTAFTEGINSLFSAVKRRARGYRRVEYITAMLYLVAGKLTLPCN
jgi:transposase